jgi:hypothetical protein
MYDAPCGAMVWTQQFIADIRRRVPHFRYRGVDVVAHVAGLYTLKSIDPALEQLCNVLHNSHNPGFLNPKPQTLNPKP